MTENKVFIAEQETLLEVKEQTEKLIRNLIPTDAPIYGMVIHEASAHHPQILKFRTHNRKRPVPLP